LTQVRFHLFPEVSAILDNSRDKQRQSAEARNLDGQVDALVRVNPAEENQAIAAVFLKRVE
jgi:hypothetical protein